MICEGKSEEGSQQFDISLMLAYTAIMNSRHRKTLEAVFAEPTKTNIAWMDIEALLVAKGCMSKEGAGSRVKFKLGDEVLLIHRPHPQKEAKAYVVRATREFLIKISVTP